MTNTVLRLIILIFTALMFSNCENGTNPDPAVTYSKILFKREGGGNKHFYTTTNSNMDLVFNVIRWDFRDTSYTVSRSDTASLSTIITNLLDGKATVSGDFQQPSVPTGTWAYLYVVGSDNIETEITNTSIRNSLLTLETLAESLR